MKPIFATDITQNKNNETINGLEFICATATAEQTDRLEEKQEGLEETLEKTKQPLWMRILRTVCGFLALVLGGGIVKALPDVGLEQVFQRSTVIVLLFFFFLAAWIVLKILSVKKEKAVLEEQNAEEQVEKIEQDAQAIYELLGVPTDATEVDVISFFYKVKNGEVKPTDRFMLMTPFFNTVVKLFATEDSLCLADTENCFSFAKNELRAIRKVNKRIPLAGWYKDEAPTKGCFKPYKLRVNQFGQVFVKPYYILEIVHGGEEFGIYFPCYEKEAFEKASGLTAEE